jgi:hypothetical protein
MILSGLYKFSTNKNIVMRLKHKVSFRRGGSPYEKLDIGMSSSYMQKPLDSLSGYHAYDRIRLLCKDFLRHGINYSPEEQLYYFVGGKLHELDIEKIQAFIASLTSAPSHKEIKDLAADILNNEWELKWLWWYIDIDDYRIRDYADYINSTF